MLNSAQRFHRRKHLDKVYKQGKSIRGGTLSLKFRINQTDQGSKVAVVVSKKVAKSAVTRNRIRRRVFEAIRLNPKPLLSGFEGIFIVYDKSIEKTEFKDLQKQVASLLDKAK